MTYATINSKLYNLLYQTGGDRLIAVYCIIKASKSGKNRILPITSGGKTIKHYRLLHKTTGISEKTLKKYIPELEKLNLCNFSKYGGFYLTGNNKVNSVFKSGKTKFVKIKIGTIAETALCSFFVRIKSLENTQINKIAKHQRQINIIARAEKGYALKSSERKTMKSLIKNEITIGKLKTHCDKVVLSNEGFAKLKTDQNDKKQKGHYWKSKLVKSGMIKTKRIFEFVCKSTYEEYLSLKINTQNRKLLFRNGIVYLELISEFKSVTCNSW